MRIASIVINAVIFITTAVLVARCFRKDGAWHFRRGLKAFRYFTVLSNVLCAVAALAMAVGQAAGAPSPGVVTLKYLGTVSVTVTLLTVFLFLGPTQGGYRALLSGDNCYMHLIGPLLAILSFRLLEKREMAVETALLGVAPVLFYGAVYLYKIICAPEERRWEDFYGFNKGGRWPLTCSAMLAGTLAVCFAFWLI